MAACCPPSKTQLAEHFDLHGLWREADPKAFLARHGAEFVGLASATHETRKAMGDLVLDKLLAYFCSGQVKAGVPAA